MRVVGVDKEGRQRCWFCGGLEFTAAQMTREKIVQGIYSTVTGPAVRCAHCGEYSDTRREGEFTRAADSRR